MTQHEAKIIMHEDKRKASKWWGNEKYTTKSEHVYRNRKAKYFTGLGLNDEQLISKEMTYINTTIIVSIWPHFDNGFAAGHGIMDSESVLSNVTKNSSKYQTPPTQCDNF